MRYYREYSLSPKFHSAFSRTCDLLNAWRHDATRLIGRPTTDQLEANLDEAEFYFEEADRLWDKERRRVCARRFPREWNGQS